MLTYEELLALWNDEANRSDMTLEQLNALLEGMRARGEELAEAGLAELTDDERLELSELAAASTLVQESIASAEGEAEAREAEAAAALAALRGDDGDAGGDDAAAAEDPDGTGEAAAAEGESEGGAGEGDEPDPDDAAAEDPELVTASGTPARPTGRVSRVNARRRPAALPANTGAQGLSLVASANLEAAGIAAGETIGDAEKLADAYAAAWNSSRGYRGGRTKIPVAMAGNRDAQKLYGEARFLGRDPHRNETLVRATQETSRAGREAIRAAGGRCVPSPVRYDLPIIEGSTARPVRDGLLTSYGADRGGVVTIPPPVIDDVDAGGVAQWTEANDVTPADPATKPCLSLTCPEEIETVVYAVTQCLRVGNFRARFNPEQVEAWQRLLAVWQARFAEQLLLATVDAGSTAVDGDRAFSAARSVLDNVDRAIASIEDHHRLADGLSYTIGLPRWVRRAMRTDIARQLPVGSVDETLAYADSAIDGWFTRRGANPVWLLDGGTGELVDTQDDGDLVTWPTEFKMRLFPTGSWLFLDGGSVDLGVIRDTATVAVNDFVTFQETWEEAHFHGVESQVITLPFCPDGTVSGAVTVEGLCEGVS